MTETILILVANPQDTERFQFEKEVQGIQDAYQQPNLRRKFNIVPIFAVDWPRFQRELLNYDPTIVHFLGHGKKEKGLVLEGSHEDSYEVSSERLANTLREFPQLECVVLDACDSQIQAKFIQKYVPYVVGMRGKVAQESSREFAKIFYHAVFSGKGYNSAFNLGREAIVTRSQDYESRKPVFFEQRSLLIQALDENASEEVRNLINKAYQYAIPIGWEQQATPEKIQNLFNSLDDVPIDVRGWGAGVKFLAYLYVDTASNASLNPILSECGRRYSNDFFKIVGEVKENLHQSANIDQETREVILSSHLLVLIQSQSKSRIYDVTTWLVNDYDRNSITKPSVSQIKQLLPSSSITWKLIPQYIKNSITEAASKNLSLLDLKIEVFLPLEQMHLFVESWELNGKTGLPVPMGVEYKVVLRDSGRLDKCYEKRDRWITLWHHLQQNQTDSASGVLVSGAGDPAKKVFPRLNTDYVLGLKMAEPPPSLELNRGRNHVFVALQTAGCPITIWLRKSSSDIDCEIELDDFLDRYEVWHLPQRVKELRNIGIQCDDDEFHIGKHIALMWENPYLLPPEQIFTDKFLK